MIRKLASLALVTAALPLGAQRRADFQWANPVSAGSTVSVRNISGDVKVTASTSNKVEVLGFKSGRGRLDRVRANVDQTSRGIVVCVLYDDAQSCDDNNRSNNRRRWNDDDD